MEGVTGFTANMTGLTNQLKIYIDKTETVPQNCRAGQTFFVCLFFNKLVTVIFGTKCNINLIKENICLFVFPVQTLQCNYWIVQTY